LRREKETDREREIEIERERERERERECEREKDSFTDINVAAMYRGTSLIRNRPTLAPGSRFMSRALWWS